MKNPQALHTALASELSEVRGVCLDIDDTLSSSGKLTAPAYAALWRLHDAGFAVVPITGRPAGWCDHFARFWPVHAVVGENGAFTFFMQDGVRRRMDTLAQAAPAAGSAAGSAGQPRVGLGAGERTEKIKKLGEAVRAHFPHARWASDQSYREYDLAIDICEDVPPWPQVDVEELLRICAREGAHAKLSSIHVNAWFGDYDKRSGFEAWLKAGAPGYSPGCSAGFTPSVHTMLAPTTSTTPVTMNDWLFIGDSPNDEPMFAAFKHTVGVANLGRYLHRLKHPPRWITESESGAGFAEMADALIRAQKKP